MAVASSYCPIDGEEPKNNLEREGGGERERESNGLR
jgi:hypothetical protein